MFNRPLNAVLTRLAIVFAVLATLVLILPAASAQEADNPCNATGTECDYDENGTDPVATYVAADPEGQGIEWELDGPDAEFFDITGGVLSFMSSPDYEDPKDKGRTADNTVTPPVTAEDAANNVYLVTVVAIEMLAEGQDPPAKRKTLDVQVKVENVDEPGSISFNRLQTRVGVSDGVTATLTDPDTRNADGSAFTISPTWTWSIPKVNRPVLDNDDHWTDAGGVTTHDDSHSATAGDANKVLRAKASYTDAQGTATKTAYATVAHTVAPALAAGATNNASAFDETTVTFMVAEDSAVGTVVGTVKATDADAGDILSHELTGTDAASFDINMATGEITLAAKLDHERTTGGNENYSITVTAYDPSNLASGTAATVTVTATDVNEAPNEPTGTSEVSAIDENHTLDSTAATNVLGTYTATDQDDGDSVSADPVTLTLELGGDDAAAFELTDADTFGGTADNGQYELRFKSSPDAEAPTDANEDNVYKVSIVAKDDDGLTNMKDLSITVNNVNELGTLTVSPDQPGIGIAVDATLTDPDNGIANASWQWYAMATKPDVTTIADSDSDNSILDDLPATAVMIEGADSMSYTPRDEITADPDAGIEAYDGDEGMFLIATVHYSDAAPPMDDATTEGTDESLVNWRVAVSTNAVRAVPDVNNRPVFSSATMMREVNENESTVPDAVTATDPDGDPLEYDITGGADMDAFSIDDNGKISTKGDTELDYEGGQRIYVVEVTASDPFRGTASTMVTINVMDVNEAPEFEADDPEDYAENGIGAVATFTASDPEGAAIEWSISGLDAADFEIDKSTGVLTFAKSPDFEMPSDRNREAVTEDLTADPPVIGVTAESPNDNDYLLMVTATEVRAEGVTTAAMDTSQDITVTVTNVDEAGTINLNRLETRVGEAGLEASLTDPDRDTTNTDTTTITTGVTWLWSVPKVNRPDTDEDDHWTTADGGTTDAAAYTPGTSDAGATLRVKASYTDGEGANKEAYALVANPVGEARTDTDNNDPAFGAQVTTSFTVDEDVAVGTVVGTVKASDDDSADVISHVLTATGDSEGKFEIDIATGVITVASALNHEDATLTDGAYTVTVTAYDANNEDGSTTVTITATDVNEAPDAPALASGSTAVAAIDENHTLDSASADNVLGTYTANDQDVTDLASDGTVTLELAGDDAAAFELTDAATFGGTVDNGEYELRFKSSPDYEAPTSTSGSNAYKVSIIAKDNEGLTSKETALTIMVNNVDEPGEVTLSTRQPAIDRPITAELADEDGGISGAEWQWYGTDTMPTDADNDGTITVAELGGASAAIEGATSPSYTPKATVPAVEDDPNTPEDETAAEIPGDEGKFLSARVIYRDAASTTEDDDTTDADESLDRAEVAISENAVRDTPLTNSRPDFGGDQMREVQEDDAGMAARTTAKAISPAVAATDADGDHLRYTISGGADMDAFEINRDTGQLSAKASTTLDYEGDQTTFMVEVSVTDPFGGSDMTMVTIMVTDFNEQPTLGPIGPAPAENVPPAFADDTASFMVDENMAMGTAVGNVGMPEDIDPGDTLTYMSSSMYFDVDNMGNITTAMMLDYEEMDEHMVTVTATDDEDASDSIMVTITVGDRQPGCTMADNMGLTNDCEALLDAMGDLGGSLDWSEDTAVSDWEGVTVSDGRVTRIWLRAKGLDGTISMALNRLDAVTVLNLSGNDLTGGIPDLGGMALTQLYLSQNDLTGMIPASVATNANMTDLWLWGNMLTGPVPDMSGMTSLEIAKLQNNMLGTGSSGIPDGSMLPPNARWILLQENGFGGTIPDLSGLNVKTLWLHTNGLTGAINTANLPTSLTSLELRDNSLSGEIPDLRGQSNLVYLRLQGNDLSGEIPGSLGDLANLQRLNVSDNDLTGIGDGLENAADTLTQLYLSGNQFTTGTCLMGGLADVAMNDFTAAGLEACQ